MRDPLRDRNFVIVGGGTAGWLCALYLARRFPKSRYPEVRVHLIESPSIGTIGVGEGSTPALNLAFEALRLQDDDWMAPCDATYKMGVEFAGWGPEPSYFHPFEKRFHKHIAPYFLENGEPRYDAICPFVDAVETPRLEEFMDTSIYYCPDRRSEIERLAYHFDAGLLADYLKHRAIGLGLIYRTDTVEEVERKPDGGIRRLHLRDGPPQDGDWFFDCSGFHGLLIEKALKVPFLSEKRSLFCDRALATRLPQAGKRTGQDLTYTTSTSAAAGWFWQIPLHGKDGCGYVYSGDFVSDTEALGEFQSFLQRSYGVAVADRDIRQVTFRTGQRSQAWQHNCVAFGLANHFIEPLEATAIAMTSGTIAAFLLALDKLDKGGDLSELRHDYNKACINNYDGAKDIVIAHYLATTRDDTPFWQACHRDIHVPASLQERLQAWTRQRHIVAPSFSFSIESWFTVLVGQGYFAWSTP